MQLLSKFRTTNQECLQVPTSKLSGSGSFVYSISITSQSLLIRELAWKGHPWLHSIPPYDNVVGLVINTFRTQNYIQLEIIIP